MNIIYQVHLHAEFKKKNSNRLGKHDFFFFSSPKKKENKSLWLFPIISYIYSFLFIMISFLHIGARILHIIISLWMIFEKIGFDICHTHSSHAMAGVSDNIPRLVLWQFLSSFGIPEWISSGAYICPSTLYEFLLKHLLLTL